MDLQLKKPLARIVRAYRQKVGLPIFEAAQLDLKHWFSSWKQVNTSRPAIFGGKDYLIDKSSHLLEFCSGATSQLKLINSY